MRLPVTVVGYRYVGSAPPCPYCGERTYALADDGNPASLAVTSWCGATARVPRNDADLALWPGLPEAHRP